MAPIAEKSALKRARVTDNLSEVCTVRSHLQQSKDGADASEYKKPRRSQRLSSLQMNNEWLPAVQQPDHQLPSPVTHNGSSKSSFKEGTAEPDVHSQLHQQQQKTYPTDRAQTPPQSSPSQKPIHGLSSPPFNDTQPFSQFIYPPQGHSYEVADEEGEGVWGYLIPLDHAAGETLVMRRRTACPLPKSKAMAGDGRQKVKKSEYTEQELSYDKTKQRGVAAGGYLIGRHPECDRILDVPTISNRHCIIFHETKAGHDIAVLEDLSGNGTFINESIVGRNKRRQLQGGDEVAILDSARFIFRYPRSRTMHGFNQQYSMQTQLGKGHFATVYLCVEKNSGVKYAVKKFEKRAGPGERSKVEGLQQEIAVLMSVSHPNLLCLKDVFDEADGVYLVLELAVEGELFNYIVLKSKLSEADCRKVFIQLFQGLKYLHDRSIVHRDIKPENILLLSSDLQIKLADFGLAKIIGEESFTTTLCGTPSYVAPEILESSNHRRYTRAVDVWSAGVVLYICLCGFPPFSDELYTPENPYTLSQQIKLGRFDYPSPYWDPVSDLALDLIDKMLTVDADARISIHDCLEHPWITCQDASTLPGFGPSATSSMASVATTSTSSLNAAMASAKLDFSMRKPQRERTLLSSLNDIKLAKTIESVEPDAKAGNGGADKGNRERGKLKVWAKNPDLDEPNRLMQRSVYGKHVARVGDAEADGGRGEKEPGKHTVNGDEDKEGKSVLVAEVEETMAEEQEAASRKEKKKTPTGKDAANGKRGGGGKAKREARPADEREPEVFAHMGGVGDPVLFGEKTGRHA